MIDPAWMRDRVVKAFGKGDWELSEALLRDASVDDLAFLAQLLRDLAELTDSVRRTKILTRYPVK